MERAATHKQLADAVEASPADVEEGEGGVSAAVYGAANRLLKAVIAQPAAQGALPQLFAATAEGVASGSYLGPHRGVNGAPAPATPNRAAQGGATARALREGTEELTGVAHPVSF